MSVLEQNLRPARLVMGGGVEDADDRLRELETTFCRDFTCCGQQLPDLHDLLHHYEEHHACCTTDAEDVAVTAAGQPQPPSPQQQSAVLDGLTLDATMCSSTDLTVDPINTLFAAAAAAAAFSVPATTLPEDLDHANETNSSSSSCSSSSVSDDELRTPPTPMSPQQQPLWLDPVSNNNLDWLMRVNHALLAADACAEDPSERPYRCEVRGCGKAYKNANGLKYHKTHGHCNDHLENDSEHHAKKPYHCAFGLCRKRYKNLNGLKYHIEHTHMAKLRRHL